MSTFGFRVTFTVRSKAFINIPGDIDRHDDEQVRKYIVEHWNRVGLPDLENVEILPNTFRIADNTSVVFLTNWTEFELEFDDDPD